MARTVKQSFYLAVFLFSMLCLPLMAIGQAAADLKSGNAALQSGDLDSARTLLESAAEDLPESVEAQLALAECYLKIGEIDLAIERYRQVLKLSPNHSQALPIVDALTGRRQSIDQKIAAARAMMQAGAYSEAAGFARTFVNNIGASPEQRETALLLQIESQLWSDDQKRVLSGAMSLAESSQNPSIAGPARVVAALALLRRMDKDHGSIAQAEKIVAAAGDLDETWSRRAELIQAVAQLRQSENAVAASTGLRAPLTQIPGVAYRHWILNAASNQLLQAASEAMGQGNTDKALRIVWPMLSSNPLPDPDQIGKPIAMTDGWLANQATSEKTRARITRILAYIATAEVHQSGPAATLFGYWLAAEYNRQAGSLEQGTAVLLNLAQELVPLSRPTPKRKPGEILSRADQMQRTILLNLAQRVTNEKQKSVLIKLITAHINRYGAINDLETGLAQFVSVVDQGDRGEESRLEPFRVELRDGLAQLLAGSAQQDLLVEISQFYLQLGKREFGKSAATLMQDSNNSLNQSDQVALILLSKIPRTSASYSNAKKLTREIVDRYSSAGHAGAALNAIDIAHANQLDDSGRWLAIQLKWEQAVKNENLHLSTNRKLGDQLSQQVNQAIADIVKIIESDPRTITRRKGAAFVQTIANRYAKLRRFDLAQSAIDALAEGVNDDALADWALWSRINLVDKQAVRSVVAASGQLQKDETLALDPFHKTELELIDRLLAEFARSEYRQPAALRVLQISKTYQNLKSHDVATNILQSFLTTNPGLSNSQSLEYKIVQIAINRAEDAFAKREDKENPPTELSDEYKTCIEQLAAFMKAHPTGNYSQSAENQLFNIITVYGNAGSWNVAREVLDQFAAAIPDFRSPQHLKLLKAATWLGELDRQYGVALLKPVTARKIPEAEKTNFQAPQVVLDLPANLKMPKASEESAKVESAAIAVRASAGGRGAKQEELAEMLRSTLGDDAKIMLNEDSDSFELADQSILHLEGNSQPNQNALAMIRQSQQRQFHQLAMMEKEADKPMSGREQRQVLNQLQRDMQDAAGQQSIALPTGSILTEAEMKRQDEAADQAYAILLDIISTATPDDAVIKSNARSHVMWLFGFFEGQLRADQAIVLINRYLKDQPKDPERVALAFQVINDQLTWAAQRQPNDRVNLAWLDKHHELFEASRQSIDQFVAEFEGEKEWVEKALLLTAESFQREAEMTAAVSRVRAGGLMVRSVDALITLLQTRPDHPHCPSFDKRMWNMAERLKGLGQLDAAIYVLSQIPIHFPTESLAQQSVLRIAELHSVNLNQPLKAVETYQEFLSLNGDNENVRSQIFTIAQQLTSKQRYLESLHVFGVFVDSFPTDPRAAQALQAMGKTHQTNEAWEEAIQSYERILAEYANAKIAPQVSMAVAECQINLSRWREARKLYDEFTRKYPKDGNAATAKARLDWLKKLDRYETLLADPEVTRHKDDAQFEIARIVLGQFANPVKAIREFEKTVNNFPDSDVADDAQLEIGKAHLSLGQMEDARAALLKLPVKFPTSPLADDALYLVAQSYEQQAARLASVTLSTARALAFDARQKFAYKDFNKSLGRIQEQQAAKRSQLKSLGKSRELALDEASQSFRNNSLAISGLSNTARRAEQQAETESALQVANRQDRINEANREAIELYMQAATDYPLGDKTDDSLLRVAQIFETQLKDRPAAMETYQKIVKLFPGTPVAEDAAWNVAMFYEQEGDYKLAAGALRDFIRSYPASNRIANAQYSLAEVLEELGQWIDAMDEYETFRQKFSDHPKARVALDQINWIRTYRK